MVTNDRSPEAFINKAATVTTNSKSGNETKPSWREIITIDPACALIDELSHTELVELGEDIKARGLTSAIVILRSDSGEYSLLDGRSLLDAMELAGINFKLEPDKNTGNWVLFVPVDGPKALTSREAVKVVNSVQVPDAAAYVRSANVLRRHLPPKCRRQLIAKLLKVQPTKSDRQIAKEVGASPTTVGTERKKLEQTGEVSKLDTRTDSDGRAQPAHKPHKPKPDNSGQAVISANARKAAYAAEEKQNFPERETVTAGQRSEPEFSAPPTTNKSKRSILQMWGTGLPEGCAFVRDLLLEEYFDTVSGGDLYDRIPTARRAEVMRALLDRLGVAGMLQAMSGQFGQELRARVPAPKRRKTPSICL
jgi:hypothetical protein